MNPKPATILGFCAEPWLADAGTWYDTRLGGPPLWPETPVAEVPNCPRCEQPRHLLLQAFAPHNAHPNRFLLLFACNSIRCSQHFDSWLAWRVCQTEPGESSSQNSTPTSTNVSRPSHKSSDNSVFPEIDWDCSDSETGSDENDTDLSDSLQMLSLRVDLARARKRLEHPSPSKHAKSTNDATSRDCDSVSLTTANCVGQKSDIEKTKCGVLFGDGPTFPATSLWVKEENVVENTVSKQDESINALLQKYLSAENERKRSNSVEAWAAEIDDDRSPPLEAFESYCDKLSSAPEQVLRYSFGNRPLWPTHPFPLPKTPCSCGSELVFEVQLLSSCLYFLRVDSHLRDGQNDAGMNFAAAAVYTCAKDCEAAHVVHRTKSWQIFEQTVVVCPDEW